MNDPQRETEMAIRIAKLERINAALMAHVERATDQRGNAFALFQMAILLEAQVRSRTEELTSLMHSLEQSNQALRAAKDEAEMANRSKTRFLAAASHDLLQPLNASRLSASALVDLALGPEARAIASQVERGLETIESLIKTLLDISKLDAGIVRPVKKGVRLRDIFAGIDASYYALAMEKGLRFVVRCPDIIIDTDAALVQRILQNLVSNAIRYTEKGGILLAGRSQGDHCLVDVIDTGCGIQDHERDLIFEEFYRGGGGSRRDAGLGLGLSIVRRMASALDHDLEVRSRPRHGSRFRLRLPLGIEEPHIDKTSDGALADFAGILVIVAENDPATSEALTRLLRTWGMTVIAGCNPHEIATQLELAGRRADLLLVDYHLDDHLTGIDIVRACRLAEGTNLPAIVMTADHSPLIEMAAAGNRCQLSHKPVKPANLRCLIGHLLSLS